MTNATDIEIYIKDKSVNDVKAWLQERFDRVELQPKKKGMPKGAQPLSFFWQKENINAIAFEEVEPGFTSIWFNSTNLPWQNDEQCALDAAPYFNSAIRITAGSWQQSADPDALVEITPDQTKTSITWPSA